MGLNNCSQHPNLGTPIIYYLSPNSPVLEATGTSIEAPIFVHHQQALKPSIHVGPPDKDLGIIPQQVPRAPQFRVHPSALLSIFPHTRKHASNPSFLLSLLSPVEAALPPLLPLKFPSQSLFHPSRMQYGTTQSTHPRTHHPHPCLPRSATPRPAMKTLLEWPPMIPRVNSNYYRRKSTSSTPSVVQDSPKSCRGNKEIKNNNNKMNKWRIAFLCLASLARSLRSSRVRAIVSSAVWRGDNVRTLYSSSLGMWTFPSPAADPWLKDFREILENKCVSVVVVGLYG